MSFFALFAPALVVGVSVGRSVNEGTSFLLGLGPSSGAFLGAKRTFFSFGPTGEFIFSFSTEGGFTMFAHKV